VERLREGEEFIPSRFVSGTRAATAPSSASRQPPASSIRYYERRGAHGA